MSHIFLWACVYTSKKLLAEYKKKIQKSASFQWKIIKRKKSIFKKNPKIKKKYFWFLVFLIIKKMVLMCVKCKFSFYRKKSNNFFLKRKKNDKESSPRIYLSMTHIIYKIYADF